MKPDYPISQSMQSLIEQSRLGNRHREADMLEQLASQGTTFCINFTCGEISVILMVYRDNERFGREYSGSTLLSVLEQERLDRAHEEPSK